MTTSPESSDHDEPTDVPFLPAAPPAVPAPTVMPQPTFAADSTPLEPADTTEFDARAMVESQKRTNANPAYGAMPKPTPESVAAGKALRAKAKRKRRKDSVVRAVIGVVVLAGVAAGGWFGYQAYQDSNDQLDADRAAAQADGGSGAAPEAITPLGNQQDVLDAIDDVNSIDARSSSGAGRAAIDNLEEILDDTGEPTAESPTARTLTLATVLPDIVVNLGERLPDSSGRETYAIYVDDFSEGDPAAYAEFVRALAVQPQLPPSAPAFADLPAGEPDQIVISIARDGETLTRAIVSGPAANLFVDVSP